jgi:hypothetical protein
MAGCKVMADFEIMTCVEGLACGKVMFSCEEIPECL